MGTPLQEGWDLLPAMPRRCMLKRRYYNTFSSTWCMHHGTTHFAGGGRRCGFTPVKMEYVYKMFSLLEEPLEELETARLLSEAARG
jgi:hypothetical protein